jgi:uncharacterized membrane protein YdfJ with MMPL/SSD domain
MFAPGSSRCSPPLRSSRSPRSREFAIALVVGVLLEVFVVRPLLVPALIVLFGW